MPPVTLESAVYPFEGLGLLPELESPPIAARRALDRAGARLSVEGWRSLPLSDREQITIAGVPDQVDTDEVLGLLRRACPAPQRIGAAADPAPAAPPEALSRALEPSRTLDDAIWSRLRAVDRYALVHTHRRAVALRAFSILGEAFDAIVDLAAEAAETSSVRITVSRADLIPSAPFSMGGTPPYPPAQPLAVEGDPPSPEQPLSMEDPPAQALSNHLTDAGEVHMVDVAAKPQTARRAVARGSVIMRPETLARLASRETPKGEVLATARIAGVMAAKRTPDLIPLCHTVALTHVEVDIDLDAPASAVHVTATVDVLDRTGCEMEAMVAASAACLTIYDMLKGIDRDMVISDVKLLEKSGGRSGHYRRSENIP